MLVSTNSWLLMAYSENFRIEFEAGESSEISSELGLYMDKCATLKAYCVHSL